MSSKGVIVSFTIVGVFILVNIYNSQIFSAQWLVKERTIEPIEWLWREHQWYTDNSMEFCFLVGKRIYKY